jgi:hypothetical protein
VIKKSRGGPNNLKGNPKMSHDLVRAIRVSVGSCRAVAKEFGVSHHQVHRIRTGENWAWLQP